MFVFLLNIIVLNCKQAKFVQASKCQVFTICAERLVNSYSDMILRVSFLYLKQTCDAEDVCQEVFLKMLLHDISFDDAEHEKAWIIRTTINACKDIVRKRAVRNLISIEDVSLPDKAGAGDNLIDKELIEALQMLPLNYRISLFLFYYEGYKIKEIAEILGKNESAVSAYLSRGRKKLKRILQEDQGGRNIIVGA